MFEFLVGLILFFPAAYRAAAPARVPLPADATPGTVALADAGSFRLPLAPSGVPGRGCGIDGVCGMGAQAARRGRWRADRPGDRPITVSQNLSEIGKSVSLLRGCSPFTGALTVAKNGHESTDPFLARGGLATVETSIRGGNPFVSVRDPLLLALASAVVDECKSGRCRTFFLLLPESPSPKCASLRRLDGIAAELGGLDYTIVLLANSGQGRVFTSSGYCLPDIQTAYTVLLEALYGIPAERLKKKCIRRLGHFSRSSQDGVRKCRQDSYLLYDCKEELFGLLAEWWQNNAGGSRAILFDLKNNEPFKNAVQGFGVANRLAVRRVTDALSNKEVADELAQLGECVLVLDVADTGTTFRDYVRRLESLGIKVSGNALAAVIKGGPSKTLDGHRIDGFLSKPPSEPTPQPCIQCELKLPFSFDSHETFARIRFLRFDNDGQCVRLGTRAPGGGSKTSWSAVSDDSRLSEIVGKLWRLDCLQNVRYAQEGRMSA